MPITTQDPETLRGATVVGTGGDRIGKIHDIYYDDATDQPEFASVATGLFGSKVSFIPLAQAEQAGDDVAVPYDKELVKGAPSIEPDHELSAEEEEELYRYYGVQYAGGPQVGQAAATTGTQPSSGTQAPAVGHDTSGPNTDNAMTRSEERLHVSTEQTEVGKARLRKHVVTEQQQVTVPVSHEEARVVREPITDAHIGKAMGGQAISEEEHEVTLHAERPVVEKVAVPVERVRLDTETVTEQQTVSAEVRKEQIETEGTDSTSRQPNRDRA